MQRISELLENKLYKYVKKQFSNLNPFFILCDPKYERYHTRILYSLFSNEEILKSFIHKFAEVKISDFIIESINSEKIQNDKSNIKDIFTYVKINNEKYKLIFEIKLNADESGDQTQRYISEAKEEKNNSKIHDFLAFYIRIGEDIPEDIKEFNKVTRNNLIEFLKMYGDKQVIKHYLDYLKSITIIPEIIENYDISEDIPKLSYEDKIILSFLNQFINLSAIKQKDLNIFHKFVNDFRRKFENMDIEPGKSVKNAVVCFWDNDWKRIEENWNIDLHYEFQGKDDCLKIHIEVDVEDSNAVNKRHKEYYKIQEELNRENKLVKLGLKTENRLSDVRSCNQLCKFENVSLENCLKHITIINNIVRKVISKHF